MIALQFESPLDRATFRSSPMFGGIDLMSARFVRHRFAPHSHDELMIGVMHAGVKSFRCGRSRKSAAPGNLSTDWCRHNRHQPIPDQSTHLTAMMRGHYAYYGISGNIKRLRWYADQVERIWHKWLS